MTKLREVVHDYVENTRFATVVGRGWDMGEETSRQEFEDFLVHHMEQAGINVMLAQARMNALTTRRRSSGGVGHFIHQAPEPFSSTFERLKAPELTRVDL